MVDGGITNIDVVPEMGKQKLSTPEDWWTIVLGSGLRWTVDQIGEAAARIREANIEWIRENSVDSVETNVIYAVGIK